MSNNFHTKETTPPILVASGLHLRYSSGVNWGPQVVRHGAGVLDCASRWALSQSQNRRCKSSLAGFSLIELLVTVCIILVLVTLYWSPNGENRQRSLKRACQENLQKLYMSMEIYANEHVDRFPNVPSARTSSEALEVLVPRYTSDTSVFICAGSKDSVFSGALSKHRISYSYYMGRFSTNTQQVLVSDKQIDTKAKAVGAPVFSATGKPPGNNHRKFGGNFLFCDGQVQSSPANAKFALPLGSGEVLLNP